MKKQITIIALSAFLLTGAVVNFSGCAGTPTRESTGEYVDDSAITTKVKAAFVNDDLVKARQITVETYKGTVQLSGFVATKAEKTHAGDLAKNVPDVRHVDNNIIVKSSD